MTEGTRPGEGMTDLNVSTVASIVIPGEKLQFGQSKAYFKKSTSLHLNEDFWLNISQGTNPRKKTSCNCSPFFSLLEYA